MELLLKTKLLKKTHDKIGTYCSIIPNTSNFLQV